MITTKDEKWISASLYYDNLELLLIEAVQPVAEEFIKENNVSRFIFNRSWERGKHLLLMFKTTPEKYEQILKPSITTIITDYFKIKPADEKEIIFPINDWFLPFPNNYIHFNDNFHIDIMETGGLQASLMAEELLSVSSEIVLKFINDSKDTWSPETGIGNAIQMHLGLVHAFGLSLNEFYYFYSYMFNNMLQMTQGMEEDEPFEARLISGLKETFQLQKDSLIAFTEYVLTVLWEKDSIEEEWLNHWYQTCSEADKEISRLQLSGQYIIPESFVFDNSLTIADTIQEKWPVMEYYLRAINSQLGITDLYELNLIYSIKESIQEILSMES